MSALRIATTRHTKPAAIRVPAPTTNANAAGLGTCHGAIGHSARPETAATAAVSAPIGNVGIDGSTRLVAGDGRYELFKSTKAFDGPVHRKQHGFAE